MIPVTFQPVYRGPLLSGGSQAWKFEVPPSNQISKAVWRDVWFVLMLLLSIHLRSTNTICVYFQCVHGITQYRRNLRYFFNSSAIEALFNSAVMERRYCFGFSDGWTTDKPLAFEILPFQPLLHYASWALCGCMENCPVVNLVIISFWASSRK